MKTRSEQKSNKALSILTVILLLTATIFAVSCSSGNDTLSVKSDKVLQINIKQTSVSRGVSVEEYNVTQLDIEISSVATGDIVTNIVWIPGDDTSFTVSFASAGDYKVKIKHTGDKDGEEIVAEEEVIIPIKSMVITKVTIIPGAIGSAVVDQSNGSIITDVLKLIASDGAAGDNFSSSISVSGDGSTVVIGAIGGDGNVNDCGSAYIYKWNGLTWDETKLKASDGAAGDNFSSSISVSGDGSTVVIGTIGGDGNVNDSGSAYIYKWNGTTWDETKLIASDGALGDNFGVSISVSGEGNTVIVGAWLDDDKGYNSGSAYVYKWNGTTWNEIKLTASDGTTGGGFGTSAYTA